MTMKFNRPGPVIAPMTVIATDGTVIRAANDLKMAWAWSEHEINLDTAYPGGWAALKRIDQLENVSSALDMIRRAYHDRPDPERTPVEFKALPFPKGPQR